MTRATQNKITHKIETITPEIAHEMLKSNTNNRYLSKHRVSHIQKEIENGNWQISGETIKIASNGKLLDGQGRLTAVLNSKKPITALVVRGLKDTTFKTIDTGRMRSMADHLHIDGYGSSTVLAAAARVAMRFNKKKGIFEASADRASPTDVLSWVAKNKGLRDAVSFCSPLNGVSSISTVAGCYYICSLIDQEDAYSFFNGVVTGEKLSSQNPALILRNRLIAIRKVGRAGGMYQKMMVAIIIHAFNCYRSKKVITKLVYAGGDIVLDGFKAV